MRAPLRDWLWRWLALFAASGTAAQSLAQSQPRGIEEPQWLKLRLNEVSAGVYAEGTLEQSTYKSSDTTATHDRIFVGPLLGLNLDGSVYHPNFLRYQIVGEGAYGESWDSVESGGVTTRRDEWQYLGRFNGSANFLANKPYNGSIFGSYDHTYRDNDFFTRVIVDQWRYGARAVYQNDPFSLAGQYAHRDEEDSGINGVTTWHDDTVSFNGRHDRKSGGTMLNYTYNQYTRTDFGLGSGGDDNTISLADNERFGSREELRLDSRASFSRNNFNNEPTDQFSAGTSLVADHRENLSSMYDATYDRYTSGGFASDSLFGQAQLRHQLYESLATTLTLQGADNESSDQSSEGYNRHFGGGVGLAYTKRLAASARLRIDNSAFLQHVDQQNIGTIENERHSFGSSSGGFFSFFLNFPNVDQSTIVVWNVGRTRMFIRGIHYRVFLNGALTRIEKITTSDIDDTVVVDYQAQPSPPGSYESFSDHFGVRLDLLGDLWGIYGRVQWFLNNAPPELLVQEITSYTAGTEVTWRWLRVGGEYEIYDSTLSSYNVARLFQAANFTLDEASTFGVEFTQSWIDYVDAKRQEQDYRFISRYHRRLTSHLQLDVDAGVDYRQGQGVDQTLAVFRPALRYVVGRTSINAEYDFEYSLYLNSEERQKHMFLLRMKRVF